MDRNKVVLVDENDRPLQEMEKLKAHELGELHRAFSIFIFNDRGELLLQQRAAAKYHGGGLWTNTCCSHPQWGEDILHSATERLDFEMGLQCPLKWIYAFTYHAEVENGLIEHEFDHVFLGNCNVDPIVNVDEVQDFRWVDLETVEKEMKEVPDRFTAWFKMALPRVIGHLKCS